MRQATTNAQECTNSQCVGSDKTKPALLITFLVSEQLTGQAAMPAPALLNRPNGSGPARSVRLTWSPTSAKA